jgi:hypothetical protein
MLQAMARPEERTVGVSIICRQPRGRSKNVDCEEMAGIERMGTKSLTHRAVSN